MCLKEEILFFVLLERARIVEVCVLPLCICKCGAKESKLSVTAVELMCFEVLHFFPVIFLCDCFQDWVAERCQLGFSTITISSSFFFFFFLVSLICKYWS